MPNQMKSRPTVSAPNPNSYRLFLGWVYMEVPLSRLEPLNGRFGLSNRELDGKKVAELTATWNSAACPPFQVIYLPEEDVYVIMGGHHRYNALFDVVRRNGEDPDTVMVPCMVSTPETAALRGQSVRDFVAEILALSNTTNPRIIWNELEESHLQSPWFHAFLKVGLTPTFKPSATVLNWPSIIKAYTVARVMLSRLASGESALNILNTPRLDPPHSALRDTFFNPDISLLDLATPLVLDWDRNVAYPLYDKAKQDCKEGNRVYSPVQMRSTTHYIFLFLVAFDSYNETLVSSIVPRFNPNSKAFGNGRYGGHPPNTPFAHSIAYLLRHQNVARPPKTRVRLLGCDNLPLT